MMRGIKVWMSVLLASMLTLPGVLHAQAPAVAPAVPTAVLQAIPADATAFLAIRNMRELNDNFTGLIQQLGLPEGLIPGPSDLLRTSLLTMDRGLNEDGSLAVVVLGLQELKTAETLDQRLVVLIPVTDVEEAVRQLGGGQVTKEGDSYRILLMGQPSLAAPKNGFLAVAQNPEALATVVSQKAGDITRTMSPDRIKEFSARDIFAWVNPRTVSKELRQELQGAMEGLLAGMPGAGPGQVFQQFEKAIDEGREFALGLSLNRQAGLTVSWYAHMQPDSELGRQMAAMKGSERSLLFGLPNEPPVLALGMVGGGGDQFFQAQMQRTVEQTLGFIGEALTGLVDAERLQQLQAPITRLITSTRQISVSISVLPVEDQKGLIGLAKVIEVENPGQWKTDARNLFGQIKQIIVDAAIKDGEPEEKVKAIADAIQWKENAEQVAGGAVDHFMVDLDKLAALEGAGLDEDDISSIRAITGPEGLLFRLAVVGNQHLVATFGGGQQRLTTVAGHVRQGEAPLAQHRDIQQVANRQPAGPRLAEGYLSIANLLALVSNVAMEMDQPLPIPPLRNAAPITLTSVKVGATAQHSEILVPMELIQSVKDTVAPLMMMMMGGGMDDFDDDDEFEPEPSGELN
jgi:hypothetical protein